MKKQPQLKLYCNTCAHLGEARRLSNKGVPIMFLCDARGVHTMKGFPSCKEYKERGR